MERLVWGFPGSSAQVSGGGGGRLEAGGQAWGWESDPQGTPHLEPHLVNLGAPALWSQHGGLSPKQTASGSCLLRGSHIARRAFVVYLLCAEHS